jgi:hypothetical protein
MAAARKEWGGKREGAGRKSGWKHGPCKAVKLPLALVDQVLAYAHQVDAGELDRGPRLEPVPPAELPAVARDDRWAQVAKLIDEKAELQRKLEHQAEVLAGVRKKLQLEEARNQELGRRIKDAGSVLRAAYDEQRRGVRKGIRAADVRSALLALGLDVEAP